MAVRRYYRHARLFPRAHVDECHFPGNRPRYYYDVPNAFAADFFPRLIVSSASRFFPVLRAVRFQKVRYVVGVRRKAFYATAFAVSRGHFPATF